MNKIILLLSLLAFSGFIPVRSQVSLKGEYEGEYYIIRVENKDPGTYSVFVDVYRADNYGGPTKRVVTVDAPREILRLKREDPVGMGRVGYRYWLAEGAADGRKDTNFVYRLPYSIHNDAVIALYTYNVREKLANGKTSPFSFISMFFHTDKGDTVYAARKGRVIRIEDKYDTSNHPELSFSTEVNQMTVLHEDGTTAYYSGIEKGKFLVRQADMVYPDTPIAIVGSFDGEKYGFYFNVGYPALTGIDAKPWGRRYYKPVFATAEGEKKLKNNTVNTALASDELIMREMTGREKKSYEKSRISSSAKK